MRAHQHNWTRFFCAFLLAFQSFLPASAMASISVRCAGSPSTSPACAQAVVLADSSKAGTYLAPMSCCQHMQGVCPMTGGPQVGHLPLTVKVSALLCLITVSPLNTERPAATVSVRQWMLLAPPALAPPATPHLSLCLNGAAAPLPDLTYLLPLGPPAASHGLRAPPVA